MLVLELLKEKLVPTLNLQRMLFPVLLSKVSKVVF